MLQRFIKCTVPHGRTMLGKHDQAFSIHIVIYPKVQRVHTAMSPGCFFHALSWDPKCKFTKPLPENL